MIPLAEPSLDGNEARYLAECVESGYVSSVGPFVDRFEAEFASTVGAEHAVACASGTAALHVALRLAGAGPSALVAVSDFTFIASANAAAYAGADVLLVDSEPETWCMNTELLYDEVIRRATVGERLPDAVEVVHVLGHPAAMEPLLELRRRFGVRIVEDAAEALGASWRTGPLTGRQVGTVGDLGCYSFNGNKIITTGGGGMIVTDDAQLAAAAKHLTTQAKVPGAHYVHDTVGYNYRLTNLAAAVGLAQLERLPELLLAKRGIAARYRTALSGSPVSLPPAAAWAQPSHWLSSVLLDPGGPALDTVVAVLAGDGVQARPLWPPLHRQQPYRSAERLGGAVAEDLYRRGLSLPSSPGLSAADQQRVTTALATALGAVPVGWSAR
ncbi:DegT/DnrJ/EryC1/StrS family aminotransferase [Jiangella asiatica]|uniref:DegT/DnrJ/EryC1/StrS aminotransferase n=1 Tax=Jiangella asiatica TaxID=2530372 RepID=A0A4R5DFC8_9ACTN|nr:DegT/DnrJ/EryC1/StrS family aminotransferase [Jiangella asiatica]TDE10591.1 DegT/DnrJ/EryC1/StrS aminotransferase [Jiangella asiatica]